MKLNQLDWEIPHLTTALTGPVPELEQHILDQQAKIESWFRAQWGLAQPPFYASIDIRNAGYKVAPVDTNLFPAGFNNLNPDFKPLCIQAIQVAIEQGYAQPVDRLLIIPETHSRNSFYLENLAVLQDLIDKAGFEVRIGVIDIDKPHSVLDGKLFFEPLLRQGNEVYVEDFVPQLVILNNDLSGGVPDILRGISQPITPALELGWSRRLKSEHFNSYQRVVNDFSEQIKLDTWLISPLFLNCGEVNFMQREGIGCLQSNIDSLLTAIQKKYDQYNVDGKPFVIVKADAGTYGMGVMTVYSAEEMTTLNRKKRTRMAKTKEGKEINKVIIQEGVYTYETGYEQDTVAEPVVYIIGHHVVGGFYRVHAKRANDENLNAPGMQFEPLAFDDCCISPDKGQQRSCHANRFYIYGVIARLAMLAAARELGNVS